MVRQTGHTGGRQTAEEVELRKIRAMTAATQLFVREGYSATTVGEIAGQSGIAVMTLSKDLGDKAAIFRRMVASGATMTLLPLIHEPTDNVEEALQKAARFIRDTALSSQSIDLARLLIAESARFPDIVATPGAAMFSRIDDAVTGLFRQLAERGLVPDGDQRQSARLFIDLVLGTDSVKIHFAAPQSDGLEASIAAKVALFIRGRFVVDAIPGAGLSPNDKAPASFRTDPMKRRT